MNLMTVILMKIKPAHLNFISAEILYLQLLLFIKILMFFICLLLSLASRASILSYTVCLGRSCQSSSTRYLVNLAVIWYSLSALGWSKLLDPQNPSKRSCCLLYDLAF